MPRAPGADVYYNIIPPEDALIFVRHPLPSVRFCMLTLPTTTTTAQIKHKTVNFIKAPFRPRHPKTQKLDQTVGFWARVSSLPTRIKDSSG